MTKVIKIKVQNLKAVGNAELSLNGCTAIITGANNSGKSSILRSLPDRIRGQKPDLILRQGENDGFSEWELSDGCKILWKFTEKSENFIFITKEGLQVKQGVLSMLQERYFGAKSFDIDKFINSTPKEQQKQLSLMLGIDFTELDLRYKNAYDQRTYKNKVLAELRLQVRTKPAQEEHRSVNTIKNEISNIKAENASILDGWETDNDKRLAEVDTFNKEQRYLKSIIESYQKEWAILNGNLNLFSQFFDFEKAIQLTDSLVKPQPEQTFAKSHRPTLTDYSVLEVELEAAQRYTHEYALAEKQYSEWIENGKKAKLEAEAADKAVKDIETEKAALIAAAKMPEGFSFSDSGLLYNGFELNKNSQSSSALYIAGLKLATMNLAELKTVHFDASFLDRKSLETVESYANSIGLQLLIERPDFEGGEIRYELIS